MAINKLDQVGPGASLRDLVGAVEDARADVDHDFEQCTKLEKRGMVAMRCHQLFGWIACRYPPESPEALAYSMTGHAWWIAGLVLQRDRKAEVKVAIGGAAWQAALGGRNLTAELLAIAVQAGALKDEAAVEAFSAAVWHQLGLPDRARTRL